MSLETIESSADLSPRAAVAFIREELEELRRADQLGPVEVQWAVEHLIGSGVGLPDVLGVVFDFSEVEWLAEIESEVASGFDAQLLSDLARQIGLDPKTGRRMTPAVVLTLRSSLPPTAHLVQRRDASAAGCEGMRQRPLRGWQG